MTKDLSRVKSKLNKTARISTAFLPTPLERLKNIGDHIGKCAVYMKRDDLTGHCFGGNKERNLEFIMADAVRKRATVIVTLGAVQSNHCRMTSALANSLGLKTELILIKGPNDKKIDLDGNFLLNRLLGAGIHIVMAQDVHKTIPRLMSSLSKKGERSYFIPGGGHNHLGALGHILLMKELKSQVSELGISPDFLVLPTGTGTTQAGLILGKIIFDLDIDIIGISISRGKDRCFQEIAAILKDTEKYLDFSGGVWYKQIHLFDDYIGKKYGVETKASRDALNLLAEKEGILIDPIYNAKAFAGLLNLIAKRTISGNIIYLNTGGIPALFTRKFIDHGR